MAVVPLSRSGWNTLKFQVFVLGILTFGQKLFNTVDFPTFYTAITTIIKAIDIRYIGSTDKNRSLSFVYYRVNNSTSCNTTDNNTPPRFLKTYCVCI